MGVAGAIAGIGVVGSLAGGAMSAGAAKDAAGAMSGAYGKGIQFQQDVYHQGQEDLNPNIAAGHSALGNLLSFYGLPGGTGGGTGAGSNFSQFQSSPFYQFPLQQSQLALNRNLAASGLTDSGGALRDATKLASGYASQGLQSYLSGLGGLVTSGQNASGSLLTGGNQSAQTVGSLYGNQGQAQAGGIVGANNAWNNAFQNALPAVQNLGQSAYGNSGSGQPIGSFLGNIPGVGYGLGQMGGSLGAPAIGTETMSPYWQGMMSKA